MYSFTKDNDIEATAAGWVIRLDRGELGDIEQQQLDAWLGASPRNLGAFVRAQAIWADTDRVAALDAGRLAAPAEVGRPSRRLLAAALAASLAAVLVAVGISAVGHYSGREATHFGEIRRLTLKDGSNIVLNASSVVKVTFEKHERRIELIRGEALFNVVHDVQRPFVVQARDVAVKAVGTSFSVRLDPRDVA